MIAQREPGKTRQSVMSAASEPQDLVPRMPPPNPMIRDWPSVMVAMSRSWTGVATKEGAAGAVRTTPACRRTARPGLYHALSPASLSSASASSMASSRRIVSHRAVHDGHEHPLAGPRDVAPDLAFGLGHRKADKRRPRLLHVLLGRELGGDEAGVRLRHGSVRGSPGTPRMAEGCSGSWSSRGRTWRRPRGHRDARWRGGPPCARAVLFVREFVRPVGLAR
jgi:hypothetical protein